MLKRFWLRRPKKAQEEPWLDRTRPFELVTRKPQTARILEYRYLDTNDRIRVPNIWFNQTVACQAAAAEWKALEAKRKLKELRKQLKLDPAASSMLRQVIQRAVADAHEEDLKAKTLREESRRSEAHRDLRKAK